MDLKQILSFIKIEHTLFSLPFVFIGYFIAHGQFQDRFGTVRRQFEVKIAGTWDGKELEDYQPAGYGGTDISVNWKYMQDEEIRPSMLVVFTDGETWDRWGDEDYCDTLWVIHSGDRIKPPFGQTVYYS